jgi:hypothetical protein
MIEVGGASFSECRRVMGDKENESITLVAKGKSYLSYFFVGVCSSVLYLPPQSNNDAVLCIGSSNDSRDDDDINVNDVCLPPIALEIHYHKPARATDLQWATNKFIEANLVSKSDDSSSSSKQHTIADLPVNIQLQLTQFNNLYQNIYSGDRYLLEYLPKFGIQLSLNDELLGTVGKELSLTEQQELARLIYSVWFGNESPFSSEMKRELLTPLEPPVIAEVADSVQLPSSSSSLLSESSNSSQSTTTDIDDNIDNTIQHGDPSSYPLILATSNSNNHNQSTSNNNNVLSDEETTLLESLGLSQSMIDEVVSSSDDSGTSSPRQTTQTPLARTRE